MLLSVHRELLIILGLSLLLSACGKKKSESPTVTPTTPNNGVPSDWDLNSDWSGSVLKAKDLP